MQLLQRRLTRETKPFRGQNALGFLFRIIVSKKKWETNNNFEKENNS